MITVVMIINIIVQLAMLMSCYTCDILCIHIIHAIDSMCVYVCVCIQSDAMYAVYGCC